MNSKELVDAAVMRFAIFRKALKVGLAATFILFGVGFSVTAQATFPSALWATPYSCSPANGSCGSAQVACALGTENGPGLLHICKFIGIVAPFGGTFVCELACPWPGALPVGPSSMCPPGMPQDGHNFCGGLDPDLAKGHCPQCEGNPINALVGNKYQVEKDFADVGAFPITFERVYNSWGAAPGAVMGFYPEYLEPNSATPGPQSWTAFAPVADSTNTTQPPTSLSGQFTNSPMDTNASWRHNYDRTLMVAFGAVTSQAVLLRGDSKARTFTNSAGSWVADNGQLNTTLLQNTDGNGNTTGWTYVDENDQTEQYDVNGKLMSIMNRAGLMQTLQYDPITTILTKVTDPFGRTLTFNYVNVNQLSSVIDPNGGIYQYTYANGNLTGVTYPDGSTRQYVYENTTYPTALTGIIDENGTRFATWSYDNWGNAITSEHAVGVEKVTMAYSTANSTAALDAGGALRTYSSQILNGMPVASSIAEVCGPQCYRTRTMAYDSIGNIIRSTDYNGNVTIYSYETRGLETSRTEGYGTTQARTIATQWHPTYRLPVQITEPGRTTVFNYDPNGNLLSKVVTAGSNSRTWSYTYNSSGQILSATNPRTDVADITNYAYDSSGNLISVTNALNQVTTLTNYDLHGRVGQITDPNGAVTTFTYAPRGWLINKTVTAGNIVQSTTYSYDNVGQLTQVALPDNSTVSYSYDSAHRLTSIKDSLGDSINYTLDLMSNRTGETVTDPNGALTRQISRIFDSVNRLQQVTGAAQ